MAPETVVTLQRELRGELKEPMGPLYTEAAALLADAGEPLVAVGDVVTRHLVAAGTVPDVALVDGKTKRDAVDEEVDSGAFDRTVAVENPAAVLTAELLTALSDALAADERTLLVVEGEEDLAAVPAILAVPDGAAVVYGQPDEGMVLVTVDGEVRAGVGDLLDRMEGDADRARSLLGV
jgi:uncharacterized protein (UPF0218 family)